MIKATTPGEIGNRLVGKPFKKGQIPWNKGTKGIMKAWNKGKTNIYSQDTIQKLRDANLGKHLSEETRKKQSESLKGRVVSDKTRLKISKSNTGKIRSEETKRKLSLINIGHISPRKGKSYEEEYGFEKAKKIKQKVKNSRAKQIFPVIDTKIEVKIQNFLDNLGIEYYTHKHLKEIEHAYQCDIFIPSMNMVVECDGNYWHNYPTGNDIDHIRTKELIEKGFKVLRLWEHEINGMNIHNFLDRCKGVK